MRIDNEVKLDYNNVLIRPKRSTLGSRSEVDLTRKYTFLNAKPLDGEHYYGIPIMAANMDGVGTFEMAETFAELGLFVCLVKSYPKHELKNWIEEVGVSINNHWAYSMGISGEDYSKFDAVYSAVPKGSIKYVCIDVANGYSERFVDYVKNIRDKYPELVIIAGNVVTGEMTEQLLLSGADLVKIGIGQGCFVPGQKVKTNNGLKNIEDIQVGEKVLTHTGSYKTVTNTFRFDDKKSIVRVNEIEATPNHEFYVLNKKYKDIVNSDNIHDYAEWVEAANLTKEYLLLKLE